MTVDSPSAQDPGPRPDPAVPEREEIHLKLLASLKAAGDGGELGVVRRLATWIDSPRVLAAIASHPPWFEDWGVKEAFVRNEHTPEELRARCGRAVGVLDLLRELDGPGLSVGERHEIRDQARALIHSLPADDRERVRRRAKELSASRDEREEPEAVVPPEPVAPAEPAAADLPEPAATPAQSPPRLEDVRPEEGRSVALSGLPVGRKVALARTSRDLAVLQVLSVETDDEVRLALLANPALGDRLAANLARTSSPAVAREIYRHRRLFRRPMVRRALLENPNVPSAALVEVVSSMGDLRGLLGLTQNPKIRSVEVKARARARLSALFRGLGSTEKIATVRSSGSSLLKALWADFFRDEELVLRCLRECHLDKGLVVEIARSSIAPRQALKLIGETPSLSSHYEVRLALARNPKTPPPVVERILPGLTAEDRRSLEGLPTAP
ncbi:MAG TPA: hypothetical protein VMR44_04360 [Thermoanaerobaculia bacterium]|nr:hypothetical protein [Thermoanaerobaculia bacterium]